MKSVIIKPNDKKQFESSLQLMNDFSKSRSEVMWDDENISFVFLKNAESELDEILKKVKSKKSTH